MIMTLAALQQLPITDSLSVSLFGFLIGFLALSSIIVMVMLLRFIVNLVLKTRPSKKLAADPYAEPASEAPSEVPATPVMVVAEGSVGEIKLHNVDERTAALLMAIVADDMATPLNQLRFISIREVE